MESSAVEMEVDLATSPPVEGILAACRVKRPAILAKYAGVACVSTSNLDAGKWVSAADYDPSLDCREDEYNGLRDKVTDVETIDEEVEEEDIEDMSAVTDSDKKVKKVKKIFVSSAHW